MGSEESDSPIPILADFHIDYNELVNSKDEELVDQSANEKAAGSWDFGQNYNLG